MVSKETVEWNIAMGGNLSQFRDCRCLTKDMSANIIERFSLYSNKCSFSFVTVKIYKFDQPIFVSSFYHVRLNENFSSRCSWAWSACGLLWGWLTVPTVAVWPLPDLAPTTAVTSWKAVWPTKLTSTSSGGIWQVGKHTHPWNSLHIWNSDVTYSICSVWSKPVLH